ncbi:cytochrome c biogenesis CcdA family protein [Amycolatopsis sp. NPDC051758]|uniref:cytochrome c biogenesis CcdA family protein n=1 Tax=Amycolatopsis sp. NPDC051758 TaxID=3363935 RepID=UPI00379C7109
MIDDLALAVVAGMLATVNPCGFAMLPGYLALVVAGEDVSRAGRLGRAVLSSGLMTAGFVAVFGVFGLVSASIASPVQRYLPAVTIVIGLALLILGALLLAGRELLVVLPKLSGGAPNTRIVSMLGYGVAFAVASLSCTIGPFLAVTGIALSGAGFGQSVATFVSYAVGMGLVVGALAIAAALARTAVATGIRRALPYIGRIGGALLVVTGAYVGYYGFYELRLNNGDGEAADPVVDAAGRVQSGLSDGLNAIGPLPVALGAVALVVAGVLLVRRRRARDRRRAASR